MWSHFKHLSLEWGGWFELLRQSGFLSTSTLLYYQEVSSWIKALIATQIGILRRPCEELLNTCILSHISRRVTLWIKTSKTDCQFVYLIGLQHVFGVWKLHRPSEGPMLPQKLQQPLCGLNFLDKVGFCQHQYCKSGSINMMESICPIFSKWRISLWGGQ